MRRLIIKASKDLSKLEKRTIIVSRGGRMFQQTVYVKPEEIQETPVGAQISPDVLGMNLTRYTDKSILIKGNTYANIDTLKEIKKEIGVGTYNKKLGGWVFPYKHQDTVLGIIYSKVKDDVEENQTKKDVSDSAPNEDALDNIKALKQSYKVGQKVKLPIGTGVIVDSEPVDGEMQYTVKTDKGKLVQEIDHDEIEVLPETDDKKIAESINKATAENRNEVTTEIYGNKPGKEAKKPDKVVNELKEEAKAVQKKLDKTGKSLSEAMMGNQNAKKDFKPEKTEVNLLHAGESKSIKVDDYTNVIPMDILAPTEKSVESGEKPYYIPDADEVNFKRNGYSFDVVKLDEDKYVVATNGYFSQGIKFAMNPETGRRETQEVSLEDMGLTVVNRDVLVATQQYYRMKAKIEERKKHNEREAKRKQWYEENRPGVEFKKKGFRMSGVLSDNKATHSMTHIHRAFNPDASRSQFWEHHGEIRSDMKQKLIDMNLQREDIENTHAKGRETSYGDTNLNNKLLKSHGVNVKRQNGDDINDGEIKQIEGALDSIYNVFGDRTSMSEKWNLKISHSGDKKMHASKARGLFVPHYHAIGVSAESGEEQFGFTLAHEFGHFMDHYVGKASNRHYATDDSGSLAHRIAKTFRKNMQKPQSSDYQNRTVECFARAFEQYHAIKIGAESEYQARDNHPNTETYKKEVMPLVEQWLKDNDHLLKAAMNEPIVKLIVKA